MVDLVFKMNFLNDFCQELVHYLSGLTNCHKLIKFHETGEFDFSFAISLSIWKHYIKSLSDEIIKINHDNILIYATSNQETQESDAIERLKISSSNWSFDIKDVKIKDHRCYLTINRLTAYSNVMREISNNLNYGKQDKIEDETISLEAINQDYSISETNLTPETSISDYRVQVTWKILKNLITYSKYIPLNDSSLAKHKLLITSKSNFSADYQKPHTNLLCGVVKDQQTKKISQSTAQDYIKQRIQDMHLVSVHKYGVRVKNDENFLNLMEKLGCHAATLDLLEVKQSSAVILQANPLHAFIFYNSARMETLMAKFDERVNEGYYGKLLDLNSIDSNLLKEEEEWELLKQIILFPDMIDRAIGELITGKPSIHVIYKYLTNLVNIFSIYYRRVRLLTENRAQLMPVLYAKIHFLKCLQRIMNETLAIFSIEPIAFM